MEPLEKAIPEKWKAPDPLVCEMCGWNEGLTEIKCEECNKQYTMCEGCFSEGYCPECDGPAPAFCPIYGMDQVVGYVDHEKCLSCESHFGPPLPPIPSPPPFDWDTVPVAERMDIFEWSDD
jgi:hypothetical protein